MSDETLRYIARSLNGLRRRSYGAWSPELESLRLLANAKRGHATPPLADPSDSGHPLVMDYQAAANRLGVSKRTLQRLIATGALATIQVLGARKVAASDLAAYVESLPRERFSA
jgi:excisionase family DNA binding protein